MKTLLKSIKITLVFCVFFSVFYILVLWLFAQGPKVSVFPDAETGKPNEVYFVGRSKIVQQDKDIIADKIKMTMNPKDFVAEGNVRTIIHNIDTKDEEDL